MYHIHTAVSGKWFSHHFVAGTSILSEYGSMMEIEFNFISGLNAQFSLSPHNGLI